MDNNHSTVSQLRCKIINQLIEKWIIEQSTIEKKYFNIDWIVCDLIQVFQRFESDVLLIYVISDYTWMKSEQLIDVIVTIKIRDSSLNQSMKIFGQSFARQSHNECILKTKCDMIKRMDKFIEILHSHPIVIDASYSLINNDSTTIKNKRLVNKHLTDEPSDRFFSALDQVLPSLSDIFINDASINQNFDSYLEQLKQMNVLQYVALNEPLVDLGLIDCVTLTEVMNQAMNASSLNDDLSMNIKQWITIESKIDKNYSSLIEWDSILFSDVSVIDVWFNDRPMIHQSINGSVTVRTLTTMIQKIKDFYFHCDESFLIQSIHVDKNGSKLKLMIQR